MRCGECRSHRGIGEMIYCTLLGIYIHADYNRCKHAEESDEQIRERENNCVRLPVRQQT